MTPTSRAQGRRGAGKKYRGAQGSTARWPWPSWGACGRARGGEEEDGWASRARPTSRARLGGVGGRGAGSSGREEEQGAWRGLGMRERATRQGGAEGVDTRAGNKQRSWDARRNIQGRGRREIRTEADFSFGIFFFND
jgi:hypothetical protein